MAASATVEDPPLWTAASEGQFEVQRLLDNGEDIGATGGPRAWTPREVAAMSGPVTTVQLLLDNGAEVSAKTAHGLTPLHYAARQSQAVAVVLLLIDNAAEVSAKNKVGLTPLHLATFHGHKAVVQLLIQRGAELSATTDAGLTPEDMATVGAHLQIAAMLKAEALRRAQCEAFAMGQHERLGAGSWVQELEPGVVQMIVAAMRNV